jgi:hypothetical protein
MCDCSKPWRNLPEANRGFRVKHKLFSAAKEHKRAQLETGAPQPYWEHRHPADW